MIACIALFVRRRHRRAEATHNIKRFIILCNVDQLFDECGACHFTHFVFLLLCAFARHGVLVKILLPVACAPFLCGFAHIRWAFKFQKNAIGSGADGRCGFKRIQYGFVSARKLLEAEIQLHFKIAD